LKFSLLFISEVLGVSPLGLGYMGWVKSVRCCGNVRKKSRGGGGGGGGGETETLVEYEG
jgi:hypothetical protein